MSEILIDNKYVLQMLKERMNNELIVAAESMLEKALLDIEKTLREKHASMVIAFLDCQMCVECGKQSLQITIKHEEKI